jgi:hypothetical protein
MDAYAPDVCFSVARAIVLVRKREGGRKRESCVTQRRVRNETLQCFHLARTCETPTPSSHQTNRTNLSPLQALPLRRLGLTMAIYIIRTAFNDGIGSVPFLWPIIKAIPWLILLWAVKFFFSGVSNKSDRNMHGRVVLVTVRTADMQSWTKRLSISREEPVV